MDALERRLAALNATRAARDRAVAAFVQQSPDTAPSTSADPSPVPPDTPPEPETPFSESAELARELNKLMEKIRGKVGLGRDLPAPPPRGVSPTNSYTAFTHWSQRVDPHWLALLDERARGDGPMGDNAAPLEAWWPHAQRRSWGSDSAVVELTRPHDAVPTGPHWADLPINLRIDAWQPERVALLAKDKSWLEVPRDGVVALDVESSGLGANSGTVAFLVGLAWIDAQGRAITHLLFMEDWPDEAALLHRLGELLEGAHGLITFNGAAFDIPLLERRFRYHGLRSPFAKLPHWDVLKTARTLWRDWAGGAALQRLEGALLNRTRELDVPGAHIPDVYRDYIMGLDRGRMGGVLRHNALDLYSLFEVAAAACDMLDHERAPWPADSVVFGAAKICRRADRDDLAFQLLWRRWSDDKPSLDAANDWYAWASRLLRTSKEPKDVAWATDVLKRLADRSDLVGLKAIESLARDAEHRRKALDDALSWTHRAGWLLDLLEALSRAPKDVAFIAHRHDVVARRMERLMRKIQRQDASKKK